MLDLRVAKDCWHLGQDIKLTFGSIAAHQRRSNHNLRS